MTHVYRECGDPPEENNRRDMTGQGQMTRRSRPGLHDAGGTTPRAVATAPPTADERTLMASLGIGVADGAHRYGDFRYERLSDAVNYVKLVRQRPITERDRRVGCSRSARWRAGAPWASLPQDDPEEIPWPIPR